MKLIMIEDLLADETVSCMVVPNYEVFKREVKRSVKSSGKAPVWLDEGFGIKVYSSNDNGETFVCEFKEFCECLAHDLGFKGEETDEK